MRSSWRLSDVLFQESVLQQRNRRQKRKVKNFDAAGVMRERMAPGATVGKNARRSKRDVGNRAKKEKSNNSESQLDGRETDNGHFSEDVHFVTHVRAREAGLTH